MQMAAEDASEIQRRIMEAKFDFNDLLKQTRMVARMGSMGGMLKLIPGMNKVREAMSLRRWMGVGGGEGGGGRGAVKGKMIPDIEVRDAICSCVAPPATQHVPAWPHTVCVCVPLLHSSLSCLRPPSVATMLHHPASRGLLSMLASKERPPRRCSPPLPPPFFPLR